MRQNNPAAAAAQMVEVKLAFAAIGIHRAEQYDKILRELDLTPVGVGGVLFIDEVELARRLAAKGKPEGELKNRPATDIAAAFRLDLDNQFEQVNAKVDALQASIAQVNTLLDAVIAKRKTAAAGRGRK